MRSTFSVLSGLITLTFLLLISSSGYSQDTEIFVRLHSNPFEAPHYIFSSEENGEPETIALTKGSVYTFIRTDSGHPFNIGSGWREVSSSLEMSSTATDYTVSGIASIQEGEQLTLSIPTDFAQDSIAYYCYLHSGMVGSLVVEGSEPLDTDGDGIPDSSDNDDDADGVLDQADAFPLDADEVLDTDSDGIGNNADTDDDADGVVDESDAFPLDSSETVDTDNDGIGNNADTDDDNDGVADSDDAFPLDATESVDSDADGIGNNADTDDDNDTVSDDEDADPLDSDISLPAQIVSVMGNPSAVIGQQLTINIGYDVNNGDNQLPGIGLRIHYDSSVLDFTAITNLLSSDLIVGGEGPFADEADYDDDTSTDRYISAAWASLFGNWPNVELPAQLLSMLFSPADNLLADTTTHINFSSISNASGFLFEAQSYHLEIVRASWDFDKNGEADALTDGLLLLRYAFGLTGDSLTDGVIALDSTLSANEVEVAMESAALIADIDGNGEVDALTDGLLLLRYLFGLSGDSLINGAVATDATRTTSQAIEQYLNSYMPGASDPLENGALGLLVPVASDEQLSTQLSQSYTRTFGIAVEASIDMMDGMPMAEAAADSDGGTGGGSGNSFTTTYTLEAAIDEHDFVKYDGNHLFIAPSYSMIDDCCFIFEEPIAFEDDAIEVGDAAIADEPYYPPIPEERYIKIMATNPDQASVAEAGAITITDNRTIEGLYTNDTQLAAISSSGWWGLYGDVFMDAAVWRQQTMGLSVYDIADVTEPQLDWQFELEGGFVSSRKKGDVVYLVARHTPSFDGWIDYPTPTQEEENQETLNNLTTDILLPKAYVNGEQIDFLSATDCMMINQEHEMAPDQFGHPTMTMLIAVDVAEKEVVNSACYLESTSGIYVSENAIYFIQTDYAWTDTRTLIHRFNLSSDLAYTGSGEVQGQLTGSGQVDFRISEYEEHLRVVSSQWTGDADDNRDHQLTILRQSEVAPSLDPVAMLPNDEYPQEIGKPNEDLYGVRFFGDTLYLVTFERTDPLYVLDLSDQTNPIVAGELEVTGFSDFLHPVNDDLLLGLGQDEDGLVKLELFNVADIENPFSLTTTSLGYDSFWSHSPARYNRHAFTYQQLSESTDRFSVPVNLSYSTSDMGYVQENRLYMFNLNNKNASDMASFTEAGYISGGFNNWWNNDRQRAFFHGDSVFYINGDNVLSSFWGYPED